MSSLAMGLAEDDRATIIATTTTTAEVVTATPAAGKISTTKQQQQWTWEGGQKKQLTPEQAEMLELTIDEVRASPLCSCSSSSCANANIAQGGRTAVWRYLEGASWRLEPAAGGKRASEYFLETLQWRRDGDVDNILDRAHTFKAEAASGKLFVRGCSLLGRPLIWVHAGREERAGGGEPDPEADIQFLIYTVERAIASMERTERKPGSNGQFCVVIDCSLIGAGGQLPSLAFVREAVSMLVLRYPWRLGKLFIVNSGNVVYYLWMAISRLLLPRTRDKIVVVSGTEEQQRGVLLGYMSAEALKGGRLGCPGEPAFDAESYLKGGDAGGNGDAVNAVDAVHDEVSHS